MKINYQHILKIFTINSLLLVSCSSQAQDKILIENPSIVKVKAENSVSTGLLVQQDMNDFYFVVSDHMFTGSTKTICVFFPDIDYGLTAKLHHRGGDDIDLALLRVNTNQILRDEGANVFKEASYKIGDQVFSLGYNLSGKLLVKEGKIVYTLIQPLKGGYDVGISADIEKGMSGGGIFNEKGELVAITSIHANPLWETDLYYESGGIVEKETVSLISKYSMGISSRKLVQYLERQIGDKHSFQSRECSM